MEILRVQQVHSLSNLVEGFSTNFLRPSSFTSSKCCVSFRTVCLRLIPTLKLGQVICVASSEAPTPVKRGRGRPRKIKPQTQRETDNKDKASAKKRCRPKKNKQSLNDKQAENLNGVQPSTLNDKWGGNAQTSGDIISEKEEEEYSEDETYIDDDNDDWEEFEEKVGKRDAEWVDDDGVHDRWKVRASDYFEEPLIKNVIGVDGTLIDWEGESYRSVIQEITCLEWENIAFHPSPLIVLVFERYIRASDNWKVLKELEKAVQVFWDSNKLPPRTVKVDAKIERDLASALRVKDTPQLLFLRGAKLLHRDTEVRTADNLVKMIAHFYYNAIKPPCLDNINSS